MFPLSRVAECICSGLDPSEVKIGLHDSMVDSEKGALPTVQLTQSKKISNDQELIQSDPISCPQNQKGNN